MNTALPTTLPKNCAVRPRARQAHASTKQKAPTAWNSGELSARIVYLSSERLVLYHASWRWLDD
jgi:hypothetical protein